MGKAERVVPAARGGAVLDRWQVAVLVTALRNVLAAEAGAPWPTWDLPVPEARWPALVRAVRAQRLSQTLAAAGVASGLPAPVVAELAVSARIQSMRALSLASFTTRAVRILADADVPVLAFKGVTLAVQSAGDLTARGAGDVDLLVPESEVPLAHEVLTTAGWRLRSGVGPTPGDGSRWAWMRRIYHETAYDRPDGPPVDLHWRLSSGRGALPGTMAALGRSQRVSVGGAEVPTLAVWDALVVACYHARKDRLALLRPLVDVFRLLRRVEDVPPPADLTPAAGRLVRDVAELAQALLGERTGGHPSPPRLASRWLRNSVDVGPRSPRRVADVLEDLELQLRYEGTPRTAAAAVGALLLPPSYLVEEDRPVGWARAAAHRPVGWVAHRRRGGPGPVPGASA